MLWITKRQTGAKPMTRKSTPKYQVEHVASGTIVLAGASKTEATKFARAMSGDRKGSFWAWRMKK